MGNTHWYCSECGDGPLLIANNVSCPVCYHSKCNYCTEETIYPKAHTGVDRLPATSGISDAVKNANMAHDSSLALPKTPMPTSACCSFRNTANTIRNHNSYGEPEDGEVMYRWTCCGCGGDNSYDYQAGCTNCNNHWRCGYCTIYQTKG